jgi:hypothetical protein
MPAKSAKQFKFMAGIAHGMKPNKGLGPSEEVAKEFLNPKKKKKVMKGK